MLIETIPEHLRGAVFVDAAKADASVKKLQMSIGHTEDLWDTSLDH